jgi:hypothetical protein
MIFNVYMCIIIKQEKKPIPHRCNLKEISQSRGKIDTPKTYMRAHSPDTVHIFQ